MPEQLPVLSVSAVASLVKDVVEGSFSSVVVQGEISGAKLATSGHFYCDLKDEDAVLNAVAWRGVVSRLPNVPRNGDFVQVVGRITTYPKRSSYQLLIDRIETAGVGALMQQLEALKQKLMLEGLFDVERKRELPLLPRKIGIITSPTGAVIQDMLHRIEARCPRHVVLWPVSVQGAAAAAEVVAAIQGFNALPATERPDVLIVARGGGSFEDLMPFNDEVLVRAVAVSEIPVISGVGHEPDVTLCDFAADVRAPTPTAAAEIAVPVRSEMLAILQQYAGSMYRTMQVQVSAYRQQVDYLMRLLPNPLRQVVQFSEQVDEFAEAMMDNMRLKLSEKTAELDINARIIRLQDPQIPLKRGFVVMRDKRGNLVNTAKTPERDVTVEFIDGQREAVLQ